jgi:hypothetical protein
MAGISLFSMVSGRESAESPGPRRSLGRVSVAKATWGSRRAERRQAIRADSEKGAMLLVMIRLSWRWPSAEYVQREA